jgi:hypothetical protein
VRRHAKAPSAGSTSGSGSRRHIFGHAFANRGAFAGIDGSGAFSGHLFLALLGAIALFLVVGVNSASALTYTLGTPPSFCTGAGSGAGQCGELGGVAVDKSNGQIFVVDRTNFRVNQFAPSGAFVRAFGADVVSEGQHDNGSTNPEVCEPANSSPVVDVCKTGVSTASIKGAFGSPPKGIAVDPSTHVVYVLTAAARVAYFNGDPAPIPGNNSNFIGQTEGSAGEINAGAPEKFGNSNSVAVDISNPLQHYLYVATAISKIDKFAISSTQPTGVTANSYVCQITGSGVAASVNNTECGGNGVASHKDGVFSGLDGGATSQTAGNLVVDENGNVFIAEKTTGSTAPPNELVTRQIVSEFDKNGNYVTQFRPVVSAAHQFEPRPEALGISPTGNLLVTDDGPSGANGGSVVQEFNPASIPSAAPSGITSASPLAEFGKGTIGTAAGGSLGVASTDTDVYVADKTNKKIWKYTPTAIPPVVTTEAATTISKFKATVNGKVTPNFGAVTDCHFEYGTTIAYGSTAPCAPASLGAGGRPVAVSAVLSGLSFDTVYHFRLVATNTAGGPVNGPDLQFKTTLKNFPEAKTSPGATLIAQTSAKVAGEVNPNEVAITDCHFNYGTTTSYGLTSPCEPASPGSGPSFVAVTAALSGLSPVTTYHFQVEATNGDGTTKGTDQSFKTLPNAPTISNVTAVAGQISTNVTAKINPNSGLVSDCHVEYGTTTSYGSQKPCTPSPGAGSSAVDVSAVLSGLTPSTLYHYRVVAANTGGTTNGVDQGFTTLPPNLPGVFNDGSSPGLGDTFTMEGRVDPEGLDVTDCHFSYGPTGEYGRTAPCTPSAAGLGSGDSAIVVTAATAALAPNTTYHFRLFVSNFRGTSQGKDRTFDTGPAPADACPNADIRAEQGIEVVRLPDCLALEQVSPSKKGNQGASVIPGPRGSLNADGSRMLFNSIATLGECANVNAIAGDIFIGSRLTEGTGWGIGCTNPPVALGRGFPAFSFTPDFSGWIQLTEGAGGAAGHTVRQEGAGGLAAALSPPIVDLDQPGIEPTMLTASTDHTRVFLRPGLSPGFFMPGDPAPAGTPAVHNLYVAHLDSEGHPSLELVARDRNAKVWGGNCGAQLGDGNRRQGAVSTAGDRVYFSTRPTQPASGNCNEANKKRIMVSEETPTGPKIEELFQPECDRVSPSCTTTPGDDFYQGGSVDQSRVYFTSSRQLADADLDGGAASCSSAAAVSGCDLYLYDAARQAGERLVDVSAGEGSAATPGIGASVRNSITAISADGSHVYFVARTVLTTDPNPLGAVAQNAADNLYLYSYPDGDLSFVGGLAAADSATLFGGSEINWNNGAYAVPIVDGAGSGVGGDGHILLLNTRAQLTADDSDGAGDLYRYNADAGTLVRVSRAAPGGADDGAFGMATASTGTYDTGYAEGGRWVSEDGSDVVFTSKDALFPGDTNGVEDSYLWREGQLYRLPGSSLGSSKAQPIRPILSHDGSTIGYHSTERLTRSDIDTVADVYVLRPGGGFRTPVIATCEGEACQGAPPAPPSEIGAITGSLASPGNLTGQGSKPRCSKDKRKLRRAGKVRCVKPGKHKKHASKKRTGAKQGGQK